MDERIFDCSLIVEVNVLGKVWLLFNGNQETINGFLYVNIISLNNININVYLNNF